MKKTKAVLLGVILWSLLLISGCNFIRIEEEPRKPLEYSIVKNEEIPAELAALIQEKKKNEFQLTYQCEKDLFLVKGYGEQMSGGYSISVEELGWTSQAVFFRTMLLGPSDEKITISPPSYPYIVVKTEYRKEPVIFERFTEKAKMMQYSSLVKKGVENRGIKKRKCADASDKKPCSQPGNF